MLVTPVQAYIHTSQKAVYLVFSCTVSVLGVFIFSLNSVELCACDCRMTVGRRSQKEHLHTNMSILKAKFFQILKHLRWRFKWESVVRCCAEFHMVCLLLNPPPRQYRTLPKGRMGACPPSSWKRWDADPSIETVPSIVFTWTMSNVETRLHIQKIFFPPAHTYTNKGVRQVWLRPDQQPGFAFSAGLYSHWPLAQLWLALSGTVSIYTTIGANVSISSQSLNINEAGNFHVFERIVAEVSPKPTPLQTSRVDNNRFHCTKC